jgi:hypothetical protein
MIVHSFKIGFLKVLDRFNLITINNNRMSTVIKNSAIIAYIKIELSLINDRIKYYQNDIDLKKDSEKYFQLMEKLNDNKMIVERILRVSESLFKEE